MSFGGLVGTRERRVTSIFHRLRNDQYDDIGGDKCIPLSTRANDPGPPSLNGTSRSPDLLFCYEFANDTYVSRAFRLHYVYPPKASPYFNLHAMSRSISNFLQLHIRLGRALKRYQHRLMRVRENACTLLDIRGEKADPAIVAVPMSTSISFPARTVHALEPRLDQNTVDNYNEERTSTPLTIPLSPA